MKREERKKVWEKYKGHCAYCGKVLKFKDMQVDHIKPKIKGGSDDLYNLNPSCRRCNHYKRQSDIETFRHLIETIPEKLMKNSYIFKVGVDYGFFNGENKKVEFYYETQKEE